MVGLVYPLMDLDFETLLTVPNVKAFLRVIRAGESGQSEDAYRMMFGGGLFQAPPWDHPKEPITIRGLTSTAAGAYQFLASTWRATAAQFNLADFSPPNQDRGAIARIAIRGALGDVTSGNFQDAVRKCAREWASLPGSPYGQPMRTLAQALETYTNFGGVIAQETA